MSSALDQLRQKVAQSDSDIATMRAAYQAATEKINAIDLKDPKAQEQIAAAVAEEKAAFATFQANWGPLGKEIPALYRQLPEDEKNQGLELLRRYLDDSKALIAQANTFDDLVKAKTAEAKAAAEAVTKEVETNAAKTPEQTDQQNKQFIKSGGANDDKGNPPAAGKTNNTTNTNASTGLPSAAVSTPTTQGADKAVTKLDRVEVSTKDTFTLPGRRLQNPLGNFSSYTYQISLYMITPDAYKAFVASGRTNINAVDSAAGAAREVAANIATSNNAPTRTGGLANGNTGGSGSPPPPLTAAAASNSTPVGGAYLIAQSGGINSTEKRAPGFDTDFYIDDLKITQYLNTSSAANAADFSFTITEPYGFSFTTRLRKANDALAAITKAKNAADVKNPSRQFFVLGIRFLGYDQDGNIIDPKKIPGADGDPNGNSSGLYQRYFDIMIKEFKFSITGKTVVYNIKAAPCSDMAALGTKNGIVGPDTTVFGKTVMDALMGADRAGTKPGEQASTTPAQTGTLGLLTKLNREEKQKETNGDIDIANEYSINFVGAEEGPDSYDSIRDAELISQNDLDKRKWAMNPNITKTDESNESNAESLVPDDSVRSIAIKNGTPIIQAINSIILQSSFIEGTLRRIYTSTTAPDGSKKEYIGNGPGPDNKDSEVPAIRWYNLSPQIEIKGWDTKRGDWAYKIVYNIQPYDTPIVISPYVNTQRKYYGPHKRYSYWYTGKNSEVLSYQQELNNNYFITATPGIKPTPSSQGGATDVPIKIGLQPQDQPDQGKLGPGLEAQNSYMTSLYDPGAYAMAKVQILGDPDFLMQPSAIGINKLYKQFYGVDGFTINPNGGQVFIEIDFKEPVDYDNNNGQLSINESIYFWKYPADVQKDIQRRGGGVSYTVKTVASTFSKGKFIQDLECNINTFSDPGAPDEQGRQANAEKAANAGFVQAPGEKGRSGITAGPATTGDGTATTVNTGFASSAATSLLGNANQSAADVSRLTNMGTNALNNVAAGALGTIQTKLGPVADNFGRG